jgi:hypothetical protein
MIRGRRDLCKPGLGLKQPQLHRQWHKTALEQGITSRVKALLRFLLLQEIGAAFLSAWGADRALGLFQAPFAKQRLAEPENAVAVAAIHIVEFFKSGLHGRNLNL